ncbi:hypothetical protein BC829DRAFT_64531 [Chytridium lagenaria]|nr:hypothetical protein BC829DRAFT_64531 [Chytridium lagenaria]
MHLQWNDPSISGSQMTQETTLRSNLSPKKANSQVTYSPTLSSLHLYQPEHPLISRPRLTSRQRHREMAELIKVSAAVNSGFERFLVVEDSTTFLRNPEALLRSVEEVRTGVFGGKPAAIFWPGRRKMDGGSLAWRFFGIPCRDEWEQDPSIMIIDKTPSWKSLMLAWYLNSTPSSRRFRRLITTSSLHRHTHLATQTPHHPIQHFPGLAGFMLDEGHQRSFCGVAMVQGM